MYLKAGNGFTIFSHAEMKVLNCDKDFLLLYDEVLGLREYKTLLINFISHGQSWKLKTRRKPLNQRVQKLRVIKVETPRYLTFMYYQNTKEIL